MKKVFAILSMLLLCLGTMSAGGRKDFKVNENLMRSDLVKMDIGAQREVFRQCSPEMKAKLYRFKVKADLKSQDLSKSERALFRDALKRITPESYKVTGDERKKVDRYNDELQAKFEALGWSEGRIFKYVETIMTVDEFEAANQTQKSMFE